MTSPATPSTAASPRSRRLLSAAIVAIFAGLWLLLDSLGLPVPDMKQHWPAIVLLGGLASLVDFALVSRRPGSAAIGAAAIALGCFFYTFTAGSQQFREFTAWWPWLPAIVAVAFLAGWAAGRATSLPLFSAGAVAAGLALTGWGVGKWPLQLVWGGVLLAIGLVFLWRTLSSRG
ncbi:MAG: DUF5668 domain-containing protein [Thermoanaerobaculia bacterium]